MGNTSADRGDQGFVATKEKFIGKSKFCEYRGVIF